jgi:hypothetical protein
MSKLRAGDKITITDRLWAVIVEKGMIVPISTHLSQQGVGVFARREDAEYYCSKSKGERVLRLDDVTGIVQ